MLSSCFLFFLRESSFHSKKKKKNRVYLYTSCILLLPLQQSEHLSNLLTNLSAQARSLLIPVLLQNDSSLLLFLVKNVRILWLENIYVVVNLKKKKGDNLWTGLEKRAIVSHIWHVAGWVLSSQRNVVNEKRFSQFRSVSRDGGKRKEKEFAVDSSDCGTWSDAEIQEGEQNARW